MSLAATGGTACTGDDDDSTPPPGGTLDAGPSTDGGNHADAGADRDAGPEADSGPLYVLPASTFTCVSGGRCFRLNVPVEHDNPDAGTFTLRAVLLPARSAAPKGVLFVNFGGFGTPGIPLLMDWTTTFPALRQNFHLVTWDPRGTGQSTPLTCASGFAAVQAAGGPVETVEEAEADIAARQALLAQCREQHGALVDHMSYRDHAADMDAVREALSVRKLSFAGFSAGCSLGQAYAELYPARLDRVVWDSAIPAEGGARTFQSYQAPGGAAAIADFSTWCTMNAACSWPNPATMLETVLTKANAGELTRGAAGGTGPLTWLEAAHGIIVLLYSPSLYPLMVDALNSAVMGNGGVLEELSNAYFGSSVSGEVAPDKLVYYLTNCAEETDPTTALQVKDLTDAYTALSVLGPVYATDHAWCGAAGVNQDALGQPATAAGVENTILVLQSQVDLATPLEGGQEVANRLARGRLVIHDGAGHTPSTFNRCMAGILESYFVDGVVPPEGTHCPAE